VDTLHGLLTRLNQSGRQLAATGEADSKAVLALKGKRYEEKHEDSGIRRAMWCLLLLQMPCNTASLPFFLACIMLCNASLEEHLPWNFGI
jgi:hypothetical protein